MHRKEIRETISIMLIGDGYMSTTGRFVSQHSINQKDYNIWKMNLVNSLFESKRENVCRVWEGCSNKNYPDSRAHRFYYNYNKYFKMLR